jgi:hypothetical protein
MKFGDKQLKEFCAMELNMLVSLDLAGVILFVGKNSKFCFSQKLFKLVFATDTGFINTIYWHVSLSKSMFFTFKILPGKLDIPCGAN